MSRQFTYRSVLQFIEDQTDLIDTSTHLGRLRRLIHKAVFQSYNSNILHLRTSTIKVRNGVGELPCDVIRLLRVEGARSYTHDGAFVKPLGMINGELDVAYYGSDTIKDPETGDLLPVIYEQQIDYCGFYAITRVLRDQVARGLLSATILGDFMQEMDSSYDKAVGSENTISMDDFDEMKWVMRNGIKQNYISYQR